MNFLMLDLQMAQDQIDSETCILDFLTKMCPIVSYSLFWESSGCSLFGIAHPSEQADHPLSIRTNPIPTTVV